MVIISLLTLWHCQGCSWGGVYADVMQTMLKHIFWPIIDSSSLYATIYTRSPTTAVPTLAMMSYVCTVVRTTADHV